jgi:hypothetical protein
MRSRTNVFKPLKAALLAGAALIVTAATATAAPCAPGTQPAPGTFGLEFILDNSTSMQDPTDGSAANDPLGLRKTAAQLGISQLGDGDTVGVMKFSAAAATVFAPTVLTAANRQGLINQLPAGIGATIQGTNYEDAFAKAVAQLADMCAAKRAVIFLSDGIPTVGNINATNYATLGVPVYTISLGVQAATRLQTIAQATAGQYFFAADANGLQDAFVKAVSAARGFNSAGAVLIKANETKDTVIAVPAGTLELSALVTWPLNSFAVTLVSPTGQVIDGVQPPPAGVVPKISGTSASFLATNPAVGNWTLRVVAGATNPQPTSVSIVVSLKNAAGVVVNPSVTIPTATPPPPPTQVLSKLKATKKLLTRGKAFSFSFNLTLPGKVQVIFAKAGAKGGARSLKVSGKTGTNKVTIPARFFGATLKRGSYRITVKPQATAAQKLTVSLR